MSLPPAKTLFFYEICGVKYIVAQVQHILSEGYGNVFANTHTRVIYRAYTINTIIILAERDLAKNYNNVYEKKWRHTFTDSLYQCVRVYTVVGLCGCQVISVCASY